MTKEQFIALGLTEEQAEKAAAASAEELKGFIPKARFDEVNEAKKQAENDRDKVSSQLEEVKKSAGDNEALKKQIETLQVENKAAKEKYESDAKELRLSTAMKLALAGKVHDPDIVANLLDKSKIELDDNGSIKSGLKEQVEALQTSKGFLFLPEDDGSGKPQFRGSPPRDGSGGTGGGGGQVNPWKKDTFNLTEQGRLLREKPDLAKQLQAAAGAK
ncbi:phage scaffolding protein [Paenibacillus ferrarius]|uniref:phage scaffolding protein n=1 Tax=Paenibacillus ferrarius TaxID=1469647 RepID=UPI003D2D24CF